MNAFKELLRYNEDVNTSNHFPAALKFYTRGRLNNIEGCGRANRNRVVNDLIDEATIVVDRISNIPLKPAVPADEVDAVSTHSGNTASSSQSSNSAQEQERIAQEQATNMRDEIDNIKRIFDTLQKMPLDLTHELAKKMIVALDEHDNPRQRDIRNQEANANAAELTAAAEREAGVNVNEPSPRDLAAAAAFDGDDNNNNNIDQQDAET